MAPRLLGTIPTFVCLLHRFVYGTPFVIVAYDHPGLVVGLARLRVCTCMCIYTHANPEVKPVLETNIMTRIVN